MIIDGKAIAQDILAGVAREVAVLPRPPRLTVFTCAPNFETQKFLALKQKRALEVGILVNLVTLPETVTTDEVITVITASVSNSEGIIVQLPFPLHIDAVAILSAVPASHDVDVLRYAGEQTDILPPVVGAIDEIAKRNEIDFTGRAVVVVGQGRLVGQPATLYSRTHGGIVSIVERGTQDAALLIENADILILGAGVPGMVKVDMVKPGVIVFDAATSEEGGVLVGDAAPDVATVASLFTPVPGGIGPITISILLKNLLRLKSIQ
jgi:methylenetetrahydrofolate dehydrogenase (NADP+)/methenyltetrahydrofolate cyclohydrolase